MTAWALLRTKEMLGMALAALLTLGASTYLLRDLDKELNSRQQHRFAMVEANALAIALAKTDESQFANALTQWQRAESNRISARLIVGSEIVASTLTSDEAPRRLKADEKKLFDDANQIRAAYESNRKGEQPRKHLVRFGGDPRQVVVNFPLLKDQRPLGMIEMKLESHSDLHLPLLRNVELPIFLWLLAVGFAVMSVWLKNLGAKRRASLSVLVFVLIGGFYSYHLFDRFKGQVFLSDLMTAKAVEKYRSLEQQQMTAASVLDTDRFLEPRGIILADGSLSVHKQQKLFDETTAFFKVNLVFIVVAGLLLLLYFYSGWAGRTLAIWREHANSYLYLVPAMLAMGVLVLFPFIYGVTLAFTDTTLFNESSSFAERWVGVANFIDILGNASLVSSTNDGMIWNYQSFYWTLLVTIAWTIANVSLGVTIGFILAMALNTDGLKGRAIYRILLILPWAIPNYISALVWRGMFHPQFGVINYALSLFGFAPVPWFEGVFSSFVTGVVTNGWLSFPFMMVVILGALQSIPKDMYEAATLEGASAWQRLRYITLPLLRPTLIPAVVLSVVWTFNMFNVIFLVSGGEPAGANEILITKAYKIAFENYRYAYAAAYSLVIFMLLLAYGVFQTKVSRATESY